MIEYFQFKSNDKKVSLPMGKFGVMQNIKNDRALVFLLTADDSSWFADETYEEIMERLERFCHLIE